MNKWLKHVRAILGYFWNYIWKDAWFTKWLTAAYGGYNSGIWKLLGNATKALSLESVPAYADRPWGLLDIAASKITRRLRQVGVFNVGEGTIGQVDSTTVYEVPYKGPVFEYLFYPSPEAPVVCLMRNIDFGFDGNTVLFYKPMAALGILPYSVTLTGTVCEPSYRLWALAVRQPADYANKYFAAAMGGWFANTQDNSGIIKAGWACYTEGATEANILRLLAATMCVDVAEADGTVEDIWTESSSHFVRVGSRIYTAGTGVYPVVAVGASVVKGDRLFSAVNIITYAEDASDIPALPVSGYITEADLDGLLALNTTLTAEIVTSGELRIPVLPLARSNSAAYQAYKERVVLLASANTDYKFPVAVPDTGSSFQCNPMELIRSKILASNLMLAVITRASMINVEYMRFAQKVLTDTLPKGAILMSYLTDQCVFTADGPVCYSGTPVTGYVPYCDTAAILPPDQNGVFVKAHF